MNHKEFIGEISAQTKMTQKDAEAYVAALVDTMKEAFDELRPVAFQGFGMFELKMKDARIMQNPKTQEQVTIPPKMVLKFKPSALLKDKLKEMQARE